MAGKSLKQSVIHLTKPAPQLAAEFAQLSDFDSVATLLEVTPFQLWHHTHAGQRYTYISLPKKHGGVRTIQAPVIGLKLIQHKLNQVLQAVYTPKSVVHGFVNGRSVVSNAAEHSPARYILNIDLQKFFETITFARVRGMFISKPYLKNSVLASILARICCYQGALPQGSPCSPVVSNMLLGRMDSQLKLLARTHKCTYTRYADDISFSTFVTRFPRTLAEFADEDVGGGLKIGDALTDVIAKNGFIINPRKSRLQHSSGRQVVTGLTANRFPNVPQEFVRQIRAMLHAWSKFGADGAATDFFAKHDYRKRSPDPKYAGKSFVRIVKGKIDYLGMVRGHDSRAHLSLLDKYASLDPTYTWPSTLPPREVKLEVLETAVFALETDKSQGTAFNLSDIGLITCAHVVVSQTGLAVQRQGDIRKIPVTLVHLDEERDLALLKFTGAAPADLKKFEQATTPAGKGDQIILMGYPNSGPAVSSSTDRGAITAQYVRFGQARYMISCTIYQGNSGGPVLDRNYRLVGIAANGPSKLAPKSAELNGVIPLSVLSDFLAQVPAP